jgi:predicted phage terminase large subunit-like protein
MGHTIEIDGQLIDVESSLRALDRADCEDSLYTFLQYAWKYIDPSPFTPGWPLEAICEHLEAVVDGQIKRLCINIPPRCGKSSIVSVAFPAWVWAQRFSSPTSGPQVPLLHASYALALAMRDSVKTRRLIESPWYQSLWGERFQLVGDQNTKGRFANTAKGERLITAVDAKVTGEGAQIIVVDDANAANEALSPAVIETTNEWWDGTMSTRLNDQKTGAFINIQQRLGEEDLTGHILEKDKDGEWCHLMLPMEYEPERSFSTLIGWKDPRTEPGELLWPERFSEREVRKLKEALGPWKASGQLAQRPEPKGGGVIRREWWQVWEGDTYPPMDYVMASLDTAYTEKTENDYSALSIWGVFSGDVVAQNAKSAAGPGVKRTYAVTSPKVMMMFAWMERLEIHELVKKVAKTCKAMKVDKLIIENKAAGHSVAQELRRLYGHEDFMVQLYDPKGADKLARLYSVQYLFSGDRHLDANGKEIWEGGMVYAPEKQWAETVISQVGMFPKGKHDDLVDTVSMSLRHLRDLGMLQRSAEAIAETEEAMQYRGPEPAPLYPT